MSRTLDESRTLQKRAEQLIPGGVNSPVRAFGSVGGDPPFLVRGLGAHVWDADGNRYIDYVGSWGPLILGHSNPEVIEAIIQAARNGTSFGASTPSEADLAALVIEAFPAIEKVRFVSSGTEATMSAIRLARAATGRKIIVKFEGCYHGHSDALLVKAGSGVATLGIPGSAGVPQEFVDFTLALPYNDVPAVAAAFDKFKDQIACVIVEPVVGNMGCVLPTPGISGSFANYDCRGRLAAHLRRSNDRFPRGFRRSFRALQHQARPHDPGQDYRRRPARGRLRRPSQAHGHDRARRPGLSGRNAQRQSVGDGRGHCDSAPVEGQQGTVLQAAR
jgi:hypothetical protein